MQFMPVSPQSGQDYALEVEVDGDILRLTDKGWFHAMQLLRMGIGGASVAIVFSLPGIYDSDSRLVISSSTQSHWPLSFVHT